MKKNIHRFSLLLLLFVASPGIHAQSRPVEDGTVKTQQTSDSNVEIPPDYCGNQACKPNADSKVEPELQPIADFFEQY